MMNDEQIRAGIASILEAAGNDGPWYGASEGAPRNARGNEVFEALRALVARDLAKAADGHGGGDVPAR
jgi:hypothetical protein